MVKAININNLIHTYIRIDIKQTHNDPLKLSDSKLISTTLTLIDNPSITRSIHPCPVEDATFFDVSTTLPDPNSNAICNSSTI